MKTIATITALSALALNGFSQGIISFQNAITSQIYFFSTANSANKVTSAPIGTQPADSPPTGSTGVVDVGLYWSTAAFTDPSQGTLADVVTMSSTPGTFAGGTVALPGTTAGEQVYVQVFAWDSTYANPDAAINAAVSFGAWSAGPNNQDYGAIGPAELVASLNTAPAPGNSIFGTAPGQFQRCVLIDATYGPEPTSLAVGGLGVATLWMFRRRKTAGQKSIQII